MTDDIGYEKVRRNVLAASVVATLYQILDLHPIDNWTWFFGFSIRRPDLIPWLIGTALIYFWIRFMTYSYKSIDKIDNFNESYKIYLEEKLNNKVLNQSTGMDLKLTWLSATCVIYKIVSKKNKKGDLDEEKALFFGSVKRYRNYCKKNNIINIEHLGNVPKRDFIRACIYSAVTKTNFFDDIFPIIAPIIPITIFIYSKVYELCFYFFYYEKTETISGLTSFI